MISIPRFPTSIKYLPRRVHIFSTAAVVYIILKITQLLNSFFNRDEDQADAAWSASNTRAAQKVLRTATARRGLWIKCCQYVAARSDALPPEYAQVLSKSLDDCPPTPARYVTAIVSEELTQTPFGKAFLARHGRAVTIDDVFDGFNPASPIASASIAQVHVAILKDSGRKVVLKIQHPGIRPMLLQDLEDLKTLLRWVAGAEPKYDMRPVLDAWIDMVPLETSFLNEMSNLKQVKASLAKAPAHLSSNGYVPEPLPELTSDKLFVMEYIDGCKVNDASKIEKYNVDRNELINQITRSFGNQLFVSSVFSGDPHPGNFLIHRLESGGVHVLLDFGICVNVSEDIRKGFARLILAAIDNNSYALVQALGDVGVKLNRADPVASLDIIKYLFRTTASREESMKEQNEMKKKLEERNEEMERNARDAPVSDAFTGEPQSSDDSTPKKRESRSPVDSFPGDLVFFFRSLGMLRGLAVSLDVRHSYLDTLRPFAEHVLRSQCPPSERLKQVTYNEVVAKGMRAKTAATVLKRAFKALYENDMIIGMQVAAHRKGELVLNIAAGRMGGYDERPVKLDSIFNSFSSTKGLSAILFASIQDEYGVDYDDLVTKYWPEFGQNGKEGTTIAHILSHAAGLSNSLPDDMPMTRLRDDWMGIIEHLEHAAPSHPPGEKSEYHALTFGWLMAGLITKITGKSYQENLRRFGAKHGLEDECFCGTLPEDLLQDTPGTRVASLSSSIFQDLQHGPLAKAIQRANQSSGQNTAKKEGTGEKHGDFESAANNIEDLERQTENILKDLNFPATGIPKAPAYILDLNFFNHPILRSGFVPSANGHFSARALSHIFAAVANDGIVEGKRVLAAGRAAKMQTKFFDIAFRGDRAWGAGLTLFNTVSKSGRELQYGAIGHGGIGGSFAFAVPSEGFSMAVTVNKLNALSLSAAVVIAVVCRAMGVPMPSWYHSFASKAMKSFDNADDLASEGNLMEKVLNGEGDTDIMKLLIG